MHLKILFKLFIIVLIPGLQHAAFSNKTLGNNEKRNITTVKGFGPRGPLEEGMGYTPVGKQLSRTEQGIASNGPIEVHVSLHDQVPRIPPYLRNRNIPNIRQILGNKIGYPNKIGLGPFPIGYYGFQNFA